MNQHGPSLFEGKLIYTSVSQLESFDDQVYGGCNRKWFIDKVLKIKTPAKPSQKLGTQCHSQIEHYEKTGEDVLGDIVRAGRRFLPIPGPDLMLEHPMASGEPPTSFLTAAGVPFVGYIDLLHRRGEWVNDDGETNPDPLAAEAVDWKTSSKIDNEIDPDTGIVTARGYAKTADELAATWQMKGYAEYTRRLWSDLKFVRVSHGIFQTKGKKAASKRSKLLAIETVANNWIPAEALVERMKGIAATPRIEDVPANYEACGAYGGCPHKSICPRDPKKVLAELLGAGVMTRLTKGDQPMSLLAKMKEKSNGATAINAAVQIEKEKLIAEEKAAAAPTPSILPPDAPAPKNTYEPIPTLLSGTVTFTSGSGRVAPPTSVVSAPTILVNAADPVGQIELTIKEVASKKYTYADGTTVKIKPTEIDGKFYAMLKPRTAIIEPKTEIIKPEPVKIISPTEIPTTDADGFTLYLDASEDGIALTRIENYVEGLLRTLEKEFNATDIRCAPGDGPLAFGRWKGALAAFAKSKPPAAGNYACSSGNEICMVVFEAIAGLARRVIRGGR